MNELINLLQQNARYSTSELATMLGRKESDIKKQIAELEEKGIIKGYSAIVNEDLIDSDSVTAIIELKVTPRRDSGFDEIAAEISALDEVDSVFLMAGSYDLQVTIRGKGVKEISLFVRQRLSTISGVLSTTTHFILKKYKEKGIKIEDDEIDERSVVGP